MTQFWQNWLSAWAAGVTIFGLILAGGAFAATDGLTAALFSMFGNPLPADIDAHHRFAIGLMGAVTMGWGLTYVATFKALFALPPTQSAPIWRLVLFFGLVWYVVDSWISVATGFWMNAVSNTLVLVLLLIGLVQSGALSGKAATA
jgi:hypothetical protein